MESSEQMEIGQQKEDETIEVSYTLFKAHSQRRASNILQKVVAAINVQLTLENGQALPSFFLMTLIMSNTKKSCLFMDQVVAGNLDVFMKFSKIS